MSTLNSTRQALTSSLRKRKAYHGEVHTVVTYLGSWVNHIRDTSFRSGLLEYSGTTLLGCLERSQNQLPQHLCFSGFHWRSLRWLLELADWAVQLVCKAQMWEGGLMHMSGARLCFIGNTWFGGINGLWKSFLELEFAWTWLQDAIGKQCVNSEPDSLCANPIWVSFSPSHALIFYLK